MATLPKMYFNGVKVKTFKYNGVEVFEADYKKGESSKVTCWHKHKGTAGQSTANGCYTVAEKYGGSCGGHTVTVAVDYRCGYCGTVGSGPGSYCSNNSCWNNEHATDNWSVNNTKEVTDYCSNPSSCSNWNWNTRYVLGCGYDEE